MGPRRNNDQRTHVPFPNVALPQRPGWDVSIVRSTIDFLGFLLAVGLPLLYYPLVVGRLDGNYLLPFLGLFMLNVIALVIGHDHARI